MRRDSARLGTCVRYTQPAPAGSGFTENSATEISKSDRGSEGTEEIFPPFLPSFLSFPARRTGLKHQFTKVKVS